MRTIVETSSKKTPAASQIKISQAIRNRSVSDGTLQAIDEVVARLLPDHTVMSS